MQRNRQNQSPPDPPGFSELYLPNLFYASTPGCLRADQGPPNMLHTFPFPDPSSGQVPVELQCREFKANGDVPWVGNPQLRQKAPKPFNTSRMGRPSEVSKASQQVIGINRLSSWFEGHHQTPSRNDKRALSAGRGIYPIVDSIETLYPQWGRTCPARATNSTAPPDYILIGTPGAGSQCVVFEVKTWWSYDFQKLFPEGMVEPNSGPFSKNAQGSEPVESGNKPGMAEGGSKISHGAETEINAAGRLRKLL
ncbi:hypothetical protein BU17DRAFT_60286 [Hysterangium stoloniferum]|nr:hypothetical protein BU17DRAFT_60286 [Hysterangium stoloniferum]